MGRYWWTVWIKVAVLAVVLLIAYGSVKKYAMNIVGPYLLDDSVPKQTEVLPEEEPEEEPKDGPVSGKDKLKGLVKKVEEKVGTFMNYEDFIFDFADDFAQEMMEKSEQNRTVEDNP